MRLTLRYEASARSGESARDDGHRRPDPGAGVGEDDDDPSMCCRLTTCFRCRPRAAARRREQRRHAFGRRGLVFTIALSSLSTVTGLGLAQAYFRVTSTTEARAQVHVETTGPLELAIQGGVADLAPGGPIQLITVQLDNRGIQPYRLTELHPRFTNLPAGCPASASAFTPPPPGPRWLCRPTLRCRSDEPASRCTRPPCKAPRPASPCAP